LFLKFFKEWGFSKVYDPFNLDGSATNWKNHLSKYDKKVKARYSMVNKLTVGDDIPDIVVNEENDDIVLTAILLNDTVSICLEKLLELSFPFALLAPKSAVMDKGNIF
jgi:hypothetical protein